MTGRAMHGDKDNYVNVSYLLDHPPELDIYDRINWKAVVNESETHRNCLRKGRC